MHSNEYEKTISMLINDTILTGKIKSGFVQTMVTDPSRINRNMLDDDILGERWYYFIIIATSH